MNDNFIKKRKSIIKKTVSAVLILTLCFTTAVTAFADTTAVTNNTRLNLNGRSGPGTGYSVVVKIPPNSTITATDNSKNGFTQIKYNGTSCWVSSSYINYSSNRTAYTTNTKLNLNGRSGPGSNYSVLVKIPPNSTITTTNNSKNGFTQIKYNGTSCWISNSYISYVKEDTSSNYYTKNVGKVIANMSKYKTNLDGYTGKKGQCVWYVRNRGYEKLGNKGLTGIGGNANVWYSKARSKNLSTGSTPRADSIACYNGGKYGHVIYVEYYDSSTKTVYFTEANCSKAANGKLQKMSLNSFKKHNSGYQGCIYL